MIKENKSQINQILIHNKINIYTPGYKFTTSLNSRELNVYTLQVSTESTDSA